MSQEVPAERTFPDGFRWGTATAAFQIEGAVNEDGRGTSIWDTFVRTSDQMLVDDNADVADDHYHRYREDVALMKSLGTSTYRFSISWPRIFPEGTGQPNQKGLDFYNRLVDELLANGIEPFATLYHWDLPQALQDRGGWENRHTAQAFAEYAGFIAEHLSDRVRHLFTINEGSLVVGNGYGNGTFAPGLILPAAQLNQVRHHVILAHGLAVQAIRAGGGSDTKVGPAENFNVVAPVIETPENVRAAEVALRELNAGYLTAILEGAYPGAYLEAAGPDAPRFTDNDMHTIGSPVDFVGVNIYMVNQYVRATEAEPGYEVIPFSASHPLAAIWHRITPESLYWGPKLLHDVWNPQEIYVTENGCSTSDQVAVNGSVNDTDRVTFLRSYLGQLQRATAEGVPVRGYFLWSLLDNFEWLFGYSNRFGIHHVDFETQKRTPKLSASYYREIIRRNAVV
ncbi:MAG TPA: GH1 family beta-glucosidase [Acidimicrobiia bacterium]